MEFRKVRTHMWMENRWFKINFVVTLFIGIQTLPLAETKASDPNLKIRDEWFFVTVTFPDGSRKMVRMDSAIPVVAVGQQFGCMFEFESDVMHLGLRATFTAPDRLGPSRLHYGKKSMSQDGRTLIGEMTVSTALGRTGFWFSADTWDPKGRYEVTCSLDGMTSKPYEVEVR